MPTKTFIHHGFPLNFTPGPKNRELLELVVTQVDKKWPKSKNLVMDATWTNNPRYFNEVQKMYQDLATIDNLFLCNFIDRSDDNPNLPNYSCNIFEIGYFSKNPCNKIFIDFWAISVKESFRQYQNEELIPVFDSNFNTFLCYQNKPYKTRQYLAHRFINEDLLQFGQMSLGKWENLEYLYENLYEMSIEEQIDETYYLYQGNRRGMSGLEQDRCDIYSVGDLAVWNKSFLIITSMTEVTSDYDDILFYNEKVFKPIIGLRPFLLFGNPTILKYFKTQGFDIFEDLWAGEDFLSNKNFIDCTESIINVINNFKNFNCYQIDELYKNLLPRLIRNKNRFYSFAEEKEKELANIFIDFS